MSCSRVRSALSSSAVSAAPVEGWSVVEVMRTACRGRTTCATVRRNAVHIAQQKEPRGRSGPQVIDLFAAEPRVGVLEASRRLGVARGTVQARLDKLAASGVVTGWGPDLAPEALGYPVTAFLTLEIRQGSGPRRRRRAPRAASPRCSRPTPSPAPATCGPGRRAVQRRPAAGHRPGARRARHRALARRSSRWRPRSRTGCCRWRGPRSAERLSASAEDHAARDGVGDHLAGLVAQLRPGRAPYAVRAAAPCPRRSAGRSRR